MHCSAVDFVVQNWLQSWVETRIWHVTDRATYVRWDLCIPFGMVVCPSGEKIFPPLLGLHFAQSSMAKPRLLCWKGDASLRLDLLPASLSKSSLIPLISRPSIFLRPLRATGQQVFTVDCFPVSPSPKVTESIWKKTNPLCVSRGLSVWEGHWLLSC